MMKLYFTEYLLFSYFLFLNPFKSLSQSTSSTDYFRSVSSGFWNAANSWESSPDGINWVPATMSPTSVANTVTIRSGHIVTISNNTTVDQVFVQSGGILELATAASTALTVNDGAGNDIIIQSGGAFRHNIASGSQLPLFIAAAILEIQSGGMLEAANGNGSPSDYANTGSAISGNVSWGDSSIFNWNNTVDPADGITYFPAASVIPIFRVNKPISIGNTIATVINGVLDANVTVSLLSTGTKTFRNGITGAGTVTANAGNGGQFIINGTTAKLGGGPLVLNNNGLSIAPGTTVTLMSNKTINNYSGSTGTVTATGTLVCDDFLIDGNSKVQIDGTVKTTNVNGLTGSSNTTFVSGFAVNTLGSASTIEYNRPGDQTVTPLSYANLTISGTGSKKVVAASDVFVSGALNILAPNTFALNGTNDLKLNGGGTLNIKANAIFDNGGYSQVGGGGSPTINIDGTFITRNPLGFSGTNTSIPGATSSSPTTTLNINAGSTIEYGRNGDQQVNSRNDYKNMTFSGSGIKTLATFRPIGTVTIKDNAIVDASNKTFGDTTATNLTMTGGHFKVGGTGTKPDIMGTYTLTGGDIEFTNSNSTAETIRSPKSYLNIIVSGTNVKNSSGIITLLPGGSFLVKSGGIYDNNAPRIDGVTGMQTFTMEAGSTFKTGTTGGLSGSSTAALNNIETITIDPKSTIIYSRNGDQTITPLTGNYPALLLKGGGIKTVAAGTVNVDVNADSIVIDPSVVFKVSSGAKANFNNRPVFVHSNSTGTGAIGEITDGPSALLNITNVTVERFIPAKRAFRFMSSPVTTTTSIKANWMEGQNNPAPAYSVNYNNNPGYGTHITGSANPTDNFDATATNNPSLFTHNNSSQIWQAVPNVNGTLTAGVGYRLLVRGSRSVTLSNNAATPSNTILRATGSPLIGTVVYNSNNNSFIIGNLDYYSLVGNPYASPVDWEALLKQDLSQYYYVWDPNLNTRGAYVTYGNSITTPAGSQVNQNIQSGQCFFVQTKGPNPSLTFYETNKTTIQRNVFRTSSDITGLAVQLLLDTTGETNLIADGVTVLFNESFGADIGNEDADKMNNLDEEMSIFSNGKLLHIEGRPPGVTNDSIHLHIVQFRQQSYYFKFYPNNFSPEVSAFVLDTYLNKETPIDRSSSTLFPFSITTDPASFAPDRFIIIFKPAQALPVTTIDVKAYQSEPGIQVEWIVQTEAGIDSYEVEKSFDSQHFEKEASVRAKGNGNLTEKYKWSDPDIRPGNNYYRIKSVERSGTASYTNVVSINIKKSQEAVTIYPNPAKGNVINVRLNNPKKGSYAITIYSNTGQIVYTGYIQHNGGLQTHTVTPKKVIGKGSYKLQITNGDKSFVQSLQLE